MRIANSGLEGSVRLGVLWASLGPLTRTIDMGVKATRLIDTKYRENTTIGQKGLR